MGLDVFGGTGLDIFGDLGTSISAPTTISDDVALGFGDGAPAKLLWETADANANLLLEALPVGGGTDVPVHVIGDANAINVDTGFFNGITMPTLAILNIARDAYISFDAGDDGVAAAKGIYFKAAADEDIELINLSVTGTPRVFWDESANAITLSGALQFGTGLYITETDITQNIDATAIIQSRGVDDYSALIRAQDNTVGLVEIARLVGAADPYLQVGRDDTGVATNAITDALVLQMGAGANNEANNFGLGISFKLGNTASEVEERASIDVRLDDATNGSEDAVFIFNLQQNGAMINPVSILWYGIEIASGRVVQIAGNQVVAGRIIDARIDDVINSGDATTDGVIDALRDWAQSWGAVMPA